MKGDHQNAVFNQLRAPGELEQFFFIFFFSVHIFRFPQVNILKCRDGSREKEKLSHER